MLILLSALNSSLLAFSNVQKFICHHAERLFPGINVISFGLANLFPSAASQLSGSL